MCIIHKVLENMSTIIGIVKLFTPITIGENDESNT